MSADNNPMVFLAFASDKRNNPLEGVDREAELLDDILHPCDACKHVVKWKANLERIIDTFNIEGEAIRIFHFAGHGNGKGLRVLGNGNGSEQSGNMIFARGLAGFIGKHSGVKLVFLNACATEEQIKVFHKAGIPVVIATTKPVVDWVACEFATQFYKALTAGNSIHKAFETARETLLTQVSEPEDLYVRDLITVNGKKYGAPEIPYIIKARDKQVLKETLYSWQKEIPQEKKDQTDLEKPAEAELRVDAYLDCNRADQRIEFKQHYQEVQTEKRKAHIMVIHGSDSDVPGAMSDSLRKYEFPLLPGKGQDKVYHKSIPFITQGNFHPKYKNRAWLHMEHHLARRLNWNKPERISAAGIAEQLGVKYGIIWLRHEIAAENWGPDLQSFIIEYFQNFWGQDLGQDSPEIFVCLSIVYGEEKQFWSRLNGVNKKIRKELMEIEAQLPHLKLLEELKPVPKHDVNAWQSFYLPDPKYSQFVSQLYQAKKTLPMKTIHLELSKLITECGSRNLGSA